MCGIAGIFGIEGLADPAGVVGRMNDAMAHRGPDAAGVVQVGQAVLGHRRLGIIDLSRGSDQPFSSPDGRHVLAFNGEIYNYRTLRAELERSGAWTFRTASDTEVLLAAFVTWGPSCLDRLEGMFAFAVMDREQGRLFIARDRFGVKPLYYHSASGRVLFASEVRALLASGLVPRRLDPDALVDHIRYQTVHGPATIVRDVHLLPAGHWMRMGQDGLRTGRWYDPVAHVDPEVGQLAVEQVHREVRERLGRAVEKRLVSDVPFGAFLSGGIDSSAIVGLMAQASTAPVHTFSVIFNEPEFSEERYARIIAKRFNTVHTPIRLVPEDMLRLLPDALQAMDHPSADGPNTYVVSQYTKAAGITMALSGTGGDEVFGGYPVFARSMGLWHRRWVTGVPRGLRQLVGSGLTTIRPSIRSSKLAELLRASSFTVEDTYPVSRLTFTDDELHRMLARAPLPPNSVRSIMHGIMQEDGGRDLPLLSQVSLGEMTTYLQHVLLRDTDQMSMAHALEVRVPFLDHQLVEFVLGVSDEVKYPHTPKRLLVDPLKDLLPDEVVHRPKMGFVLPWEPWMRNELKSFCAAHLERLATWPQFKPGAVKDLWNKFLLGDPQVNWSRIWSLVVLEDWVQRHGIEP
jgi:asparagine synthase (glutamine-hydrolysing)